MKHFSAHTSADFRENFDFLKILIFQKFSREKNDILKFSVFQNLSENIFHRKNIKISENFRFLFLCHISCITSASGIRNSHCAARGHGKRPAENPKNPENHVFEDFCMFVLLEILNKMRLVIAILGLWAHRQVLHIEISNGRIDFKFVLK